MLEVECVFYFLHKQILGLLNVSQLLTKKKTFPLNQNLTYVMNSICWANWQQIFQNMVSASQ